MATHHYSHEVDSDLEGLEISEIHTPPSTVGCATPRAGSPQLTATSDDFRECVHVKERSELGAEVEELRTENQRLENEWDEEVEELRAENERLKFELAEVVAHKKTWMKENEALRIESPIKNKLEKELAELASFSEYLKRSRHQERAKTRRIQLILDRKLAGRSTLCAYMCYSKISSLVSCS